MSGHCAKVVWNNTGLSFNGTVDGNEELPLRLGWSERGVMDGLSPMGLVAQALAGCTAMDVISILGKKRQKVTFFEVEVEGTQQDEHPHVYRQITVVYRVGGEDISSEAVARAIELSMTKYCSVSAMIKESAEITTRYEIV